MYIVNKDRTQIINMEHVTAIYIGADGCSAKADLINGKGCQIIRYNSHEEVVMALEMLGTSIGKTEVFFFPEDNKVQEKLRLEEQKYHHITGKKTKGHGGS